MIRPKVSVCIITYNHQDYINKCLDSAVMQNVDFVYEIVIGDDNSNDNTKQICEEYARKHPNLIKYFPRHKNLGMIYNWITTIQNCNGEYVALCEGDDYWYDSNKLQKQIDFLERNQEYGFCSSNAFILDSLHNSYRALIASSNSREIKFQELLTNSNPIFTLTMVFRKELISDFDIKDFLSYSVIDLPLWFHFLSNSKGYLLSDKTAVYRKLQESASHSKSLSKNLKFERDTFLIKEYYVLKQLHGNKRILNNIYASHTYNKIVINVLYEGNWRDFIVESIGLLKMNITYILRICYQLTKKIFRIVK